MGNIVKPYKYDPASFATIQQTMVGMIGSFKGGDGFNAQADADVVEWIGKYKNNDAICTDLKKFVKALPLGETVEDGERRGNLQRFVETAMELRKMLAEMKETDSEEVRRNNLKFIGDTLEELRGDDEHPGLAETLAEYNKATDFRYVDSKEFKLLNVLVGQVDECAGWFEYAAFRQLDDDVPERIRIQNECEEGISKYNKEAEDFVLHAMNVLNLQENSFDGYYYNQQVKADVAKHRVVKAEEDIKRLDALYEQRMSDIASLEMELENEQKLEPAFQEDVAAKKEMFDERTAQMDENYVPKVPTAVDLNNQEQQRLVDELKAKDDEVNTRWNNYENALHELNNRSQQYDQDIDLEQYGKGGVNIDHPNFTNEQLAGVPKVREAEARMNYLNTKEVILDGTVKFTTEQTNALIEALRTQKDSDINALSSFKNGMMLTGYYSALQEYAKAYDVRHEDAEMVQISNGFFSRAYLRSAGVKAAIDLLKSTIQVDKRVDVLPISVALRNAAATLESSLNHMIVDNKPLNNALKLQEEKGKFIEEQTQKTRELKEQYDKSVLERTRLRAKNSNAMKDLAFTNYKEGKKNPEQIKKDKENALNVAKAEYENAKAGYEAYRKRVEDLKAKLETAKKEKDAALKDRDNLKRQMDSLKANQKFEAAEFEKMEKTFASLHEQKKALSEKIEFLHKTKETCGQKDGRMDYAAKKINFFLKHAEDGNPEKSPGKREHDNGSHYKALQKELTTLSEDLKKGGMSRLDLAHRLQTLRDVADSYLETRSRDFWAKLTGGSQFRHNRLEYVTAIRNFSQAWQNHLQREMPQIDTEAEEKLALNKKEELLPEPIFDNFGKFHYQSDAKSEDQYTVIGDDFEMDMKDFHRFATEDEVEEERKAIERSKANDHEVDLSANVWDRDTDVEIEKHANDPEIPQNVSDDHVVEAGANRQDILDAPADDDTDSVYTKFEEQYFDGEGDISNEINLGGLNP